MSSRQLACDVLVIGAGPAGIAAAVRAAEAGAKVLLVDDNPQPGGQIWRASVRRMEHPGSTGEEPKQWIARLSASGAAFLGSTRIVARLDPHRVLAEDLDEGFAIDFYTAILATGARELLLPFPGWTLENVMAAGGLQALVKSGMPVKGKRIAVAGTGPLLLAVAAFLQANGAEVVGVFEQAPLARMAGFAASLLTRPSVLLAAMKYGSALGASRYHCGWWPVEAHGAEKVEAITVSNGKTRRRIACDFVACGFHLVPNTELASAFGCALEEGRVVVDESQRTSVSNVFSVGESTGIGGLDLALAEGQIAGLAATGRLDQTRPIRKERSSLAAIAAGMNRAFRLRGELKTLAADDTIVCRCEDVPWSALRGQTSPRAAKLYTRCGMGPCQARVCGPALNVLLGWASEPARPPIYPVRLATLMAEPTTVSGLYKEKP